MEKNKKELKTFSILVLVFVALELIRNIVSVCINGLPQATNVPEGMSKALAQTITTISFALSFVLLLPQIFIGVKGIQIANGAESGKAHIIWAVILAVFAVIATISSLSEMFKLFNLDTVMNFLGHAVDLLVYVCYFYYARKIAQDK